jgi:hypothetical protein
MKYRRESGRRDVTPNHGLQGTLSVTAQRAASLCESFVCSPRVLRLRGAPEPDL